MLLSLLASTATILACLLALPVVFLSLEPSPSRDGGLVVAALLASLALLPCLGIAYGVGVHRRAFDWVLPAASSGMRWALVLVAVLAALGIVGFSVVLRQEPANQVPWTMLPLRSWAGLPWTLVLVAGAVFATWPGVAGGSTVWRWPVGVVGVASLLFAVGGIVEGLQWSAAQDMARVAERQAFDQRRDDMVLREVQAADPVKDFLQLLPPSSAHEEAPIRTLALQKLHAHPDLNGALAATLRGAWPDQAMIFLAHNDPPDAAALVEPLREGMLHQAAELRRAVRDAHTLRPDDYLYDVQRLLASADRLAPQPPAGYVDAVRAVRAAFDEPRTQKVDFEAVKVLDTWLQHGASAR